MAHALLAPSSAAKWMNCPASPHLEQQFEDTDSDFTKEGTLAHAWGALKIKRLLGRSVADEQRVISELGETYGSGEMQEHTDSYASIVMERFDYAEQELSGAMLLVEHWLSFGKYVPDAFGTADALIISDGTLEVIDLKYGAGVTVTAEWNHQMMIYALGAVMAFEKMYNIEEVRMTIIQPRRGNLSEFSMSVSDLKVWAERQLKPKALLAASGVGGQNPGRWCRFCKAKGGCSALANVATGIVETHADPRLIPTQTLGEKILPMVDVIKMWVNNVESYALEQMMSGSEIPGYKLVAGRSIRKIVDPEGAKAAMRNHGMSESEYLKPSELRTITELEKMMGKKRFNEVVGPHVDKPAGRPTLAPESDRREAIKIAGGDFDHI